MFPSTVLLLAAFIAWGTNPAPLGAQPADAGVEALRSAGPTPIILWVVEGNERACGFYESRGWVFDGGRKDERVGAQLVPHLRYRLE